MEYKVSYQKNFSPDGTCYDQFIKARMTEAELKSYNDEVRDRKREINAKTEKSSDDVNFMCFARFLVKGKNHTTQTQLVLFINKFGLFFDRRILKRNTLILVETV